MCSCPCRHSARSHPHYRLDSPLFQSSVRSLAWADIMSCVPCARPPILDKRLWLKEVIQTSREGARKFRPNNELGCCAQVLSLLGDCTTAIHSLYTQAISEGEFAQTRSYLHQQLDEAMTALLRPDDDGNRKPSRNDLAFVALVQNEELDGIVYSIASVRAKL